MTSVENIRVGVIGAKGRMGALVCETVQAANGLDLVAQVESGDELTALEAADVVVDFTVPTVAFDHIAWCVEHGKHIVVGTSGFDDAQIERVRHLAGVDRVGVAIIPNFAIGAVLMMHWAAQAARFFGDAEVLEYHHPGKVDAPSGTALHTAEIIAASRREAGLSTSTSADVADLQAARGHLVDGVPVHASRGAGFLAHQDVIFGAVGERLTIRHDSLDRACFMPGVLIAIRGIAQRLGVTVGLSPFLQL